MGRKSNQSILRTLLNQIENKEFQYESKEKEKIDWYNYDHAQINEINDMLNTIRDYVDRIVNELNIDEKYNDKIKERGRPPTHPGDLAKVILMQQYFSTSNRTTQGLVLLFHEKLKLHDNFSYKTIERAYENSDVEKILRRLFKLVQEPLKDKENDFSIDGTGLPTSIKKNYESEKYGKGSKKKNKNMNGFEQAIMVVGTNYKMIGSFEITDNPSAGESPYLRSGLNRIASLYDNIDLFAGDKGFLSRENCSMVGNLKAIPRFYPKKYDTFKAKGSKEWSNMHYEFIKDPQQWLREYHIRSISETVNSTFERMFPDKLHKKLKIRRKCEAFCRACDYNIKQLNYLTYLKSIELKSCKKNSS
jgi:transposase